ncbi:MAG TPA: NAD(P)-binding domain-containing protein [Rhodocyclaceae bacterium]|nr:NAD(P)-binding domain-containing protein [Rhodocyclaceae bacterium]
MKIGILGTGMVGQTLAAKLHALGHHVVIGTRDVAATRANNQPNNYGGPAFSVWHAQHPGIGLATFAEAASHGELLLNCTQGAASLAALELAGRANLAGKVLIDLANPLDFSKGMPPSLFICNTDSLGETIQRTYPELKVVKALNTTNCQVMVDPARVPGQHSIFVSGNDATAKTTVKQLLESFGWQDVIDLGDISTARGTEQLLPIWIRLWGTLGTADFNFAVVRNGA